MAIIAVLSADDRTWHIGAFKGGVKDQFTAVTPFGNASNTFTQESLESAMYLNRGTPASTQDYFEYEHPTGIEEMTISYWLGMYSGNNVATRLISTYWREGQRYYTLQNTLHWIAAAPPYMGFALSDSEDDLISTLPSNNLLTRGSGRQSNGWDGNPEENFNSRINYHHICYTMKCHNTSGAIKVYIDGQLYISESLLTNNLPESSLGFQKFNAIRFYDNAQDANGHTAIDDLIISDTYDDPVLVGKCLRLVGLNSALTGSDSYSNETPQDWSTSVPSASHSAMIDVDDWDDNYIETNVSGNSDVFSISYTPLDISPTPDILGIVAQTSAKHYFQSFDFTDVISNPNSNGARCIYFGDAGTELYILDANNGQGWIIHQFTLGTAYDIESWVSPNYKVFEFNLPPETQFLPSYPFSISFNSSGTRLYVGAERTFESGSATPIYQFDLTTAWDIETVQLVESPLVYFDQGNVGWVVSHNWNATGSKLWVLNTEAGNNSTVREYNASTNWDVTTLTLAATSPTILYRRYLGFTWNNNGTKAFFWNYEANNLYRKGEIHIYDIGTPYDISYIDANISPSYTTCDLFRYPNEIKDSNDWEPDRFDVTDLKFNSSGDTLFILWDHEWYQSTFTDGAHQIRAYTLDSAYDVTSVNFGKYANLIGTSSGVVENATVHNSKPASHSNWVTFYDWYPQNPQSSSDWTASDLQDLFIGVKSK